jgi:hydrogenase maturation protein HypF
LAVLADTFGSRILEGEDFDPTRGLDVEQRRLLTRLLRTGLGSPWTSSAGRLFDAVAAIVGLHQTSSFEGQAAMSLEFAATRAGLEDDGYPIDLDEAPADPDGDRKRATGEERGRVGPSGASPAAAPAIELDWRPMIEAIVADLHSGVDTAVVAARFHNGLAAALRAVAERIGEPRVALTGGCFQNALLTERTASGLETAGFEVLLHRRVPANDGGLALGQIAVGAARLVTDRSRTAGPRRRAIEPKAIEPSTIEPNRR